jgi:hypothetical protein
MDNSNTGDYKYLMESDNLNILSKHLVNSSLIIRHELEDNYYYYSFSSPLKATAFSTPT